MLILDENNDTIVLNNINDPILTESCWVFDASILDFKLMKVVALEEIVTPGIEVMINRFKFVIPAKWNIMVADMETTQVDCIEAKNLAARDFSALALGPTALTHQLPVITVTNYFPQYKIVTPIIGKTHMLCHPIASNFWIAISPNDLYNKYMKNVLIGDLT